MKVRIAFLCLMLFPAGGLFPADGPCRPVHTYSIVAYDPATGELGAAVQSHWFSAGPPPPAPSAPLPGRTCILEAGHVVGANFSCQANLMLRDTVWAAMAEAYQKTSGELVDRLLAALEAAESQGGDIRGRQSAAVIVVAGKSSGGGGKGRLFALRVQAHADP